MKITYFELNLLKTEELKNTKILNCLPEIPPEVDLPLAEDPAIGEKRRDSSLLLPLSGTGSVQNDAYDSN